VKLTGCRCDAGTIRVPETRGRMTCPRCHGSCVLGRWTVVVNNVPVGTTNSIKQVAHLIARYAHVGGDKAIVYRNVVR